eukprot:2248083-Rhodomonas_salina.1
MYSPSPKYLSKGDDSKHRCQPLCTRSRAGTKIINRRLAASLQPDCLSSSSVWSIFRCASFQRERAVRRNLPKANERMLWMRHSLRSQSIFLSFTTQLSSQP